MKFKDFFIYDGEVYINCDKHLYMRLSNNTLYEFSEDYSTHKEYGIKHSISHHLQYLIFDYCYDFQNIFKNDYFQVSELGDNTTINLIPHKSLLNELFIYNTKSLKKYLDNVYIELKTFCINENIIINKIYIYPKIIVKKVDEGYIYYMYIDI